MKESYQEQARMFCKAESDNLAYPLFGLYEEVGELIEKTPIRFSYGWDGLKAKITLKIMCFIGKRLGKWAKKIRKRQAPCPFDVDTFFSYDQVQATGCKYELGDIHWMVANLDSNYYFKSEDVEAANIEKLTKRASKNQICDHPDH